MPALRKRWLKWAVLATIPVVLFFVLREQRSWLPRTLVPTGAEKICYWPGRDVLVVACSDHTLRFWAAGSDRPAGQHKLIGFRGILLNLSFAADGNTLAVTGYSDGDLIIQVWDTANWTLLRTLHVSRALKPMTASCLAPDGSQIAVGFGDTSGGGKI